MAISYTKGRWSYNGTIEFGIFCSSSANDFLIVDHSLPSTSRVLGWRALSSCILLGYQLLPRRKSDSDLRLLLN